MPKIKLVFFDMEGTILERPIPAHDERLNASLWERIPHEISPEAVEEDRAIVKKWFAGELGGYVDWCAESCKLFQRHGLTKERLEEIMDLVGYHPGVPEVFEELRKKGVRTALITGGLKQAADRVQQDFMVDHALSACELFWKDDGTIRHWNTIPADEEAKADFMELIIKERGLARDECAFVGDGKNDVHIAEAVGISIAFNGADELQKVATHSVNQLKGEEDFRAILPLLFPDG